MQSWQYKQNQHFQDRKSVTDHIFTQLARLAKQGSLKQWHTKYPVIDHSFTFDKMAKELVWKF